MIAGAEEPTECHRTPSPVVQENGPSSNTIQNLAGLLVCLVHLCHCYIEPTFSPYVLFVVLWKSPGDKKVPVILEACCSSWAELDNSDFVRSVDLLLVLISPFKALSKVLNQFQEFSTLDLKPEHLSLKPEGIHHPNELRIHQPPLFKSTKTADPTHHITYLDLEDK